MSSIDANGLRNRSKGKKTGEQKEKVNDNNNEAIDLLTASQNLSSSNANKDNNKLFTITSQAFALKKQKTVLFAQALDVLNDENNSNQSELSRLGRFVLEIHSFFFLIGFRSLVFASIFFMD